MAVPDFEDQGRPGGGDLIESIRSVNHEAAVQSQRGQRAGNQFTLPLRRRARQLRISARGIRQRVRVN